MERRNITFSRPLLEFSQNPLRYIVEGDGLFGAERKRALDGQMVLFAQDGDEVRIENPADAKATLEVLLIAGMPLNEPIVRYGPFVMNTREEIREAFEDYRLGKMVTGLV